MADFPTLIAQIEFTAGTWTDVASYVVAVDTRRGTERALDEIQPGSMTVSLRNADRRFDPEYSAGPYFGNLVPDKKIRISATWNAVTYPVFTGFIDRIIQRYAATDSVATFECSDGLARLAVAELPSPWVIDVGSLNPFTWLRVGESGGPYAYDSSGNNHTSAYGDLGGVHYKENALAGLIIPDDDGAVKFDPTASYLQINPPAIPTTSSWSMAFLFRLEDPMPFGAFQYILYPAAGIGSPGLHIYSNDAGKLTVLVFTPGAVLGAQVSTNINLATGNKWDVVVSATSGSTLAIYVNGANVSTTASGTAHTLSAVYHAMGQSPQVATTIDEVLLFNYALSLAQVGVIESAGLGWAGDTPQHRVNRILDAVNWDSGLRNITTEHDDVLAATQLQTSALAHLRAIERTIEGKLWVTPDGYLRLLGRVEHTVAPYNTSQVTFGEGGGEIHYTRIGDYNLSLEAVYNIIKRTNGDTTVRVFDAASVAAYRPRTFEVRSLYRTLDYEGILALYRLALYSQPLPYVGEVTINPRDNPTNAWLHALGRDIADRVTYVRRPQHVGSAISRQVFIEGIRHTIRPKSWITTFSIDAIGA